MHKIKTAFAELRSLGYVARENFQCCQSCGWSALSKKEAKKAVFYHKQDGDDLINDGSCHLAWAGNGKEIISVLQKHGIKVEWNGKKDTRILITI